MEILFQTIVMKLTYQFNISCRTSEGKADVPTPDFETMHLLKLPLGYRITYTLQIIAGIYRDFAGKSECGDFKFMGIACIPAIPVILKSPHSDFHVKIVEILTLQGYYRDTPH